MIPTYPYSLSSSSSPSPSPSPMPIDLNNEDQNHELIFSPTYQPSSSSSSLSYRILFNPSQDHAGSSYWEPKHLQSDEEAGKIIASSGSWGDPDQEKGIERKRGLKLKVWKRGSERESQNHRGEDIDSAKWMPSKMRMMRKMMASDQKGSDTNMPQADTSRQKKFEDQNQKQEPLRLSPLGTDNSSSNSSSTNSNNNNITVRVCADCHTTKTPLWRSGPRGPKSLCNACGIRQRKARRAMAAAAASGSALVEKSPVKGNYKFHNREKKLKKESETQLKKKNKLDDLAKPTSRGSRIKFGFEDFTVSLSKNLAASQVFPQDEKEAAILLMALSYNGLVHG